MSSNYHCVNLCALSEGGRKVGWRGEQIGGKWSRGFDSLFAYQLRGTMEEDIYGSNLESIGKIRESSRGGERDFIHVPGPRPLSLLSLLPISHPSPSPFSLSLSLSFLTFLSSHHFLFIPHKLINKNLPGSLLRLSPHFPLGWEPREVRSGPRVRQRPFVLS